ncbi:MAG: hypothetical protein E6G34_02865 [Actinobacteria bacterium]|nr:MAG: hypothetical protein E6G34_02865 [Actinomycetota bacterium]
MTVRKTMLAASAAALMSTPVWAIPSQASSSHANGHAPKTTPVGPPSNRPADEHGLVKGKSGAPSNHGKSHKCSPHKVAFIVSGTLVELIGFHENTDGTFSGEIKLTVKRTNHHARGEKEGTVEKTYTLTNVHVTFGLSDVNKDGKVNLEDVKAGDRVKLIGKVTKIAKKCDHTHFEAQKTIRKVVFNAAS